MLTELGGSISPLPLTCFEVHQVLRPLNQLVLVILGSLLDNGSIVSKIFEYAFVELIAIKVVLH